VQQLCNSRPALLACTPTSPALCACLQLVKMQRAQQQAQQQQQQAAAGAVAAA
jgi:hypothetical protein